LADLGRFSRRKKIEKSNNDEALRGVIKSAKARFSITTPSPKIRRAIFFTVALFALAVRLPQLGERPMHTDESINAYITGELLAGGYFHYDPQDRHGPALYMLAEPVAQLGGAKNFSGLTETQLRLSTVFAGTATVLLFGAGVEIFGFNACLVAALLFAFAPLPVYYSRYFIHETLFVAATLGLILSGWRAWQKKSLPAAAIAGGCAALMLACKETAPLHFFALALAAFGCRIFNPRKNPAADFPPPKIILTAFVVFLLVVVLLFTWFGQNWQAPADLFRAIPRFAARAGGEGHEKPFWYYAKLLCDGWSGGIILGVAALGILGVFMAGRPPRRVFLAIYATVIFAIYSAIPYKTPWLALNLWLPLALFAGLGGELIWQNSKKVRRLFWFSVVALACLMAKDTWNRVFVNPIDEKNPYAYAHTTEDLLRLPARLEELARQNKLSNPRIAVVAADAWPLPWYLRKFSQAGFWQPGQETGAADFFITTTDVSGKLAERLKKFHPEFFGVRPEVVIILWSPAPAENRHE